MGDSCDCTLRAHGLHRLGCPNRERPELAFDYPQDARSTDRPTSPHLQGVDPTTAAPAAGADPAADGELREEIARIVIDHSWRGWVARRTLGEQTADALLAGPLAALVAERDQAQAKVRAVEDAIDRHADNLSPTQRAAFRRALDSRP